MEHDETAANDNDASGIFRRPVFCTACNEHPAALDGLCGECVSELHAVIEERRLWTPEID